MIINKLFLREFIEEGVVDFAQKNPGTVVYVSPQSCRIPKIVAEYCKCELSNILYGEMCSRRCIKYCSAILEFTATVI